MKQHTDQSNDSSKADMLENHMSEHERGKQSECSQGTIHNGRGSEAGPDSEAIFMW